MGQYNFKKDIGTGEHGEAYIRDFLEKRGFVFIEERKDSAYDLKMSLGGSEITFEVKTDVYPRDTGNVVIEFECRGKSSGISVTKADFFVTYFPALGEVWFMDTDQLKSYIETARPKVFENSGDKGSGTKLYKIEKDKVKNLFIFKCPIS